MGKPEDSANIFLAHRKRSGLTSKLVLQQQRIMDVTQQNKQFSTDISATKSFFFSASWTCKPWMVDLDQK